MPFCYLFLLFLIFIICMSVEGLASLCGYRALYPVSFLPFFTIILSVLWSGGTKGSDLDGGQEGGSKGLYRMGRNNHDEVFAFYPVIFLFTFVCLASQSIFSARPGLGREDTSFFFFFLTI